MKFSSSWDIYVFTELFLSEGSLVKGCYIGNRKGRRRGFNFDLGAGRLGKCRWTGFGAGKLVEGLEIGVIKLGNSVIYSCV